MSWKEKKSAVYGKAIRHSISARKGARKKRVKKRLKNYLIRFANRATTSYAISVGTNFLISGGASQPFASTISREVVSELWRYFK
ncbi:MAG: hypothetical protein Q7S21_02340 [archaeon]|nr:hypothetical protein [archaeon]